MKKLLIWPTIISSILIMNSAIFSQSRKFEFKLGGGFSDVISPEDSRNILKTGWTAGASIGYFVIPRLQLAGSAYYFRYNMDRNEVQNSLPPGTNVTTDGWIGALELLGVAVFYLNSVEKKTSYYLLGGGGMTTSRVHDLEVSLLHGGSQDRQTEHESDPTVTAGLGLRFGPQIGFFIEGRFTTLFLEGDNSSSILLRVGVAF